MARSVTPGSVATLQLAIYDADGVTKIEGAASRLVAAVSVDTGGGDIVAAGISPTVSEREDAAGEYVTSFPVPSAATPGRTYFLTVFDPITGVDAQESFEVRSSTAAEAAVLITGTPY